MHVKTLAEQAAQRLASATEAEEEQHYGLTGKDKVEAEQLQHWISEGGFPTACYFANK